MKKLFLCAMLLCSSVYAVDCNSLEKNLYSSGFTPENYNSNIQKVNNFYNLGCSRNWDRYMELGNVAFSTTARTKNKSKYLQNAYNYYIQSKSDKGFYAAQMALQLGFYYRDNHSYDNAIIWYKRAIDKQRQHSGNSGFIPAHLADAYVLKGDCSEKTFDLYSEAISNMADSGDYSKITEAQQKAYQAAAYCRQR